VSGSLAEQPDEELLTTCLWLVRVGSPSACAIEDSGLFALVLYEGGLDGRVFSGLE
jgi:hypothetical protein